MNTSGFWDNILNSNEKLLWTGRPEPRLHWRNWRLYATAPVAAIILISAAWFILKTSGTKADMWLIILPTLLALIPLRTTWRQLNAYAATRYALTDERVLFFRLEKSETRVVAHPRTAAVNPKLHNTIPPSVKFLRYGNDKSSHIGFEFITSSEMLLPHLEQAAQ